MSFFELTSSDISDLSDGDLRELVARLCEAELIQQGLPSSSVSWGGAQEAADGGLDVSVRLATLPEPNFVPRAVTGIQVKKNSMPKSACKKEMIKNGQLQPVIKSLAAEQGAYIIVSGADSCAEKMLVERVEGMREAVSSLPEHANLHLDFYGADKLANWLRCHPSVSLWVRARLGRPLTGWRPYGRWAATPVALDDSFLLDEHPCITDQSSSTKDAIPVLAGLELVRERLRKPRSAVRITGLSGVGKTRFAQALFEGGVGTNPLPQSDVIYADLGDALNPTAVELLSYLIAKNSSCYLVLDNCPPEAHRSLQKQLSQSTTCLHLLTIEYDISDDGPENTDVIHLEPSSEATVAALLQKRLPELGAVNAGRVAEFSGGNARVALALAGQVENGETLSKFRDQDLFKRLFMQRKGDSESLLKGAEALALVYSFNVNESLFNDELGGLSEISGLNRNDLFQYQAELLRRQLAQQRGFWRAVLPHALANRLAKRALENTPYTAINAVLFKPENIRLFQSCAHRLGYLHDVEPAQMLARSWFQDGAPLHDISQCSEAQLKALIYVAPVFPEMVLRALEQAANVQGFASRENPKFRAVVQLLCHLAYDDHSFDRAVNLLLMFAESEEPDENNDSVVERMRQLFSLHLSGTQASPERRQAYVRRLLGSPLSRHRGIAGRLLEAAFEAMHWSSFRGFHFGARKRSHGWQPANGAEKLAWYEGFIAVLTPFLISEKPVEVGWAKSILARHFRALWSFAGAFDVLEKIAVAHGQNGCWAELWLAIRSTISFDGDRLDSESLMLLQRLESLIAPKDHYSEIEAYVLAPPIEHIEHEPGAYEASGERLREKVIQLGIWAASDVGCLDRLGGKLWSVGSDSLWDFGRGLAEGRADKDSLFDQLVTSFQERRSDHFGMGLMFGFLCGVYQRSAEQAHGMLARAIEHQGLRPYSVHLLCAVPLDNWVVNRLLELASEGDIEAWRFQGLAGGQAHKSITDADLALLLQSLNQQAKGYLAVIEILRMRFWKIEEESYAPDDTLRAVGRDVLRKLFSAQRDEYREFQLYGVGSIVKVSFSGSVADSEIREIITLLCEGLETWRLNGLAFGEVISALIKHFPEQLLDVVFADRGPAYRAQWVFRDLVGRERATLNHVPIERLLNWCGGNQLRVMELVNELDAYSIKPKNDSSETGLGGVEISEHMRAFMAVAADKIAFIDVLFEKTSPMAWSGSRASIIDARAQAFAELLSDPDVDVRMHVNARLVELNEQIEREREIDRERDNRLEQTFE